MNDLSDEQATKGACIDSHPSKSDQKTDPKRHARSTSPEGEVQFFCPYGHGRPNRDLREWSDLKNDPKTRTPPTAPDVCRKSSSKFGIRFYRTILTDEELASEPWSDESVLERPHKPRKKKMHVVLVGEKDTIYARSLLPIPSRKPLKTILNESNEAIGLSPQQKPRKFQVVKVAEIPKLVYFSYLARVGRQTSRQTPKTKAM